MNLYNRMPAKEVVILGSGDIGMIMARRLTLEGAHVQAVFEIQPYPSGLPRNIEQCLNDYDIPLYLSHTVTGNTWNSRLTGVTVSAVDEHFKPSPGSGAGVPVRHPDPVRGPDPGERAFHRRGRGPGQPHQRRGGG